MAKAAKGAPNGTEPQVGYLVMPLDLIVEPETAARETMDQAALDDLQESMSDLGLLSPITVKKAGEVYEVVYGHRRLLAARNLGWKGIPVHIFTGSEAEAEAAKLHENVVREQLNAAEEAVFFAELLEKHALDEEGLCRTVHRSPDYVGDRLRLLRGDGMIFQALRTKQISFAAARELNKFDDEVMRRYYLDAAIRSGASSRIISGWLNEWRAQQSPSVVVPAPVAGEVTPHPLPATVFACEFCGGDKDPYNLVTIQVHKWELEEIRKALQGQATSTT